MGDSKSNVITQLRLKAEKIRKAWSKFDKIQNNIELLYTKNEQLQYRLTFENLYFDLKSEVDDRLSGREEIKIYRLRTVTYGLVPAVFFGYVLCQ